MWLGGCIDSTDLKLSGLIIPKGYLAMGKFKHDVLKI
jgi:hypothetical protein